MGICGSMAAAAVSTFVPGADAPVDLLKNIWELYERIKEIAGLGNVCQALIARIDLLDKWLDSVKPEDNSAIADVLVKYTKTVKEFRDCLAGWIEIAEKPGVSKLWDLRDVPDKIEEFNRKIDELRKDLNVANIIDRVEWENEDSKWKKRLENNLDQLTKQIAKEGEMTRDHVINKSNEINEHTTARINSLRENIRPKDKIIDALIGSLENASKETKNADDKTKDELSRELLEQCDLRMGTKKEEDAIHGLLALVKCGSNERLLAADRLSKLAETQTHLEVINEEDGVSLLMDLACEAIPVEIERIKQIETTLGAIYYFSEKDKSSVIVEIVEPLLLVLTKSTNPGHKKMAAGVLKNLSSSKSWCAEIAAQGGISELMNALCSPSSNSIDQQGKTYAGEALKNLSEHEEYQREFAEAIPRLLRLLKASSETSSDTQKDSALLILKNLAYSSDNFEAEIVDGGVIQVLRDLIDEGFDTVERKTRAYAASALELLSTYEKRDSSEFEFGAFDVLGAYQYSQYKYGLQPQNAADRAYEMYDRFFSNA